MELIDQCASGRWTNASDQMTTAIRGTTTSVSGRRSITGGCSRVDDASVDDLEQQRRDRLYTDDQIAAELGGEVERQAALATVQLGSSVRVWPPSSWRFAPR
jgi:hypothetical protein